MKKMFIPKHRLLYSLAIFLLAINTTLLHSMDPAFDQAESSNAHQNRHQLSQKFNDLIIIFDPQEQEHIDSAKGLSTGSAITIELVFSLYEQAAPLIATSNFAKNVCFLKTDEKHKTMLAEIKAVAEKTANPEEVRNITSKLVSQVGYEGDTYVHELCFSVLSLTNLNNKNWCGYIHKNADLVLLIPKNYIAKRVGVSVEHVEQSLENYIKECGFRLDDLDKIEDISPDKFLAILQNQPAREPAMNMDALEAMFVTQKKKINKEKIEPEEPNQGPTPLWHIYLGGHGGPGRRKKDLDQTGMWQRWIDEKEEEIKKLSNANDETTQQQLEDAKRTLEQYHQYLEDSERSYATVLKNNPELPKSIQNLSDEAVVPETAQLIGLSFGNFSRLMKFFERNLKTEYVHYSTCFSGGYNQAFVNEMLTKLNVSFLASSAGISEFPLYGELPQLIRNDAGNTLTLSPKGFSNFFTTLREVFGEPRKKGFWQRNPLETIVKTMIVPEKDSPDLIALPFVRIPNVGVFNAIKIDEKVSILTNTLVKIHEFENHPINLSNQNLNAVLVYPDRVNVPLKLGERAALVSVTPKELAQQPYHAFHIFDEVEAAGSLSSFFYSLLTFNKSFSTITFLIKKLTCQDYEDSGLEIGSGNKVIIENMLVQIPGEGTWKPVDIIFNVESKIYAASISIQNFEYKEGLLNECNHIKMSLITREEMPALAEKFLGAHDISDIKEPITLSMIADKIDAKVDKSSATQKPGHLKKILLSHVLKALENAPVAELARQGKTKLKYVNNEYKKLEMAGQLAEEELDSIKKKIGILKERISAANVQSNQKN
ncbi:hypothetical protein IPF37_04330 [bacterium]|nr:MAG: hypothetical protein IPF37_04330 [bacterium]